MTSLHFSGLLDTGVTLSLAYSAFVSAMFPPSYQPVTQHRLCTRTLSPSLTMQHAVRQRDTERHRMNC